MKKENGFSFMEILVVIIIIGITTGLVLTNDKKNVTYVKDSIVVEQVKSTLKYASTKAKTTLLDVVVDLDGRYFKIAGEEDIELLEGAIISGNDVTYNKYGQLNIAGEKEVFTITVDGKTTLINAYKDGRIE